MSLLSFLFLFISLFISDFLLFLSAVSFLFEYNLEKNENGVDKTLIMKITE